MKSNAKSEVSAISEISIHVKNYSVEELYPTNSVRLQWNMQPFLFQNVEMKIVLKLSCTAYLGIKRKGSILERIMWCHNLTGKNKCPTFVGDKEKCTYATIGLVFWFLKKLKKLKTLPHIVTSYHAVVHVCIIYEDVCDMILFLLSIDQVLSSLVLFVDNTTKTASCKKRSHLNDIPKNHTKHRYLLLRCCVTLLQWQITMRR